MEDKNGSIKRMQQAFNQPAQHEDIFWMSDEQAMNILITRLAYELEKSKEPDSLYYAWQSNIAMAFFDAARKHHDINNVYFDSIAESETINIANQAAKNFLDSLCKQKNL